MRLYVKESVKVRGEVTGARSTVVRERKPSVGEVVVWLRGQGAGRDMEVFGGGIWPTDLPRGRYLVIPLDTEPPKETE